MDYYIVPDVETDCIDDFPAGLSYFFEQIGGYNEFAEANQISNILQIDLSMFQQLSYDEYDYDEGDEESQPIWHDIVSISELVSAILTKISAFPNYHKQVLYNPINIYSFDSEYRRIRKVISESSESEFAHQEAVNKLNILEGHPLFYYPPNAGYLSNGGIIEDLNDLQQLLQCYQANGATRVKLMYM